MTTYLLNSAVIPDACFGVYEYAPATWAELREVCGAAPSPVSRIGYEQTASLIAQQTGLWPSPSRERTVLAVGDVAYVVRLKYHLPGRHKKGAPVSDRLEDWEVGRLVRVR